MRSVGQLLEVWTGANRARRTVRLGIGDQTFVLTPGEALQLADRLVDCAERAQRPRQDPEAQKR